MRAQVVYESMFGNTMLIAEAIAEGLARHAQVDLVEVGKAGLPPQDVDLLVIGGPTHAFGLSRPNTRKSAEQQTPRAVISGKTGIREWIATLGKSGIRVPTVTFDTKLATPKWLTGSASRSAAKLLKSNGIAVELPSASFYVNGTLGPLDDGELTRARHWGDWVGRQVCATIGQTAGRSTV